MICTCERKITPLVKAKRFDPTRTTSVRLAFTRELNRRFRLFIQAIKKALIEDDVFGLNKVSTLDSRPGQFDFARDRDKIKAFMSWLKDLQNKNILQIVNRPGTLHGLYTQWTDKYIMMSYQKGLQVAKQQLLKKGVDVPLEISAMFNSPVHLNRVGAIYTRVFSELEGITNAMDTQISRVLADGLMQGLSPLEMANNIVDKIESIGLSRARTLARTETIRAHHLATIEEYRQYGIEGVSVQAEWLTAGDDIVCPRCFEMEGKIFSLDEIEPLIPLHPNCRCAAIPYVK